MAAHSCTSFRFADSVLHPATVRASRPRAPTLALRILPPGKGQLRMGWDSNPRNGYPFTRSPGACLQPLGHLSELLDAQTRSKYKDRPGFATGGTAPETRTPVPRILGVSRSDPRRGATYEHAAQEARARRYPRSQQHPHLAGAGGPVPRPDEG